ncbi:hypothetical protein AB205_0113510 [Aquarana catesbeiana]|uniref:Uncharacterized protein n=1 Tax=Aquarana catesbeiana TaxID=8400 RepID=A0A2G9QE17_AQUCT|nr:hypothetical protein AB205_0113510 [Aquarana catesbeiana]
MDSSEQALINSPHQHRRIHQELSFSSSRSAMVSNMASILDGTGDCRPKLSTPLLHTMSMPSSAPISTVSDKFHHPYHHPHHHHQQLSGNVCGSFSLIRDVRGIPSMNNLYSPYKDMTGMGQSLSPLTATPVGNNLGSIHNSQQSCSAHTAMLARGYQHLFRGLATTPSAMMSHLSGMHHPGHSGHAQSYGPVLTFSHDMPPSSSRFQLSNFGQLEEIDTKEVVQRITAEIKKVQHPPDYLHPEGAVPVPGTLSHLLRTPILGVN